MQVPFSRLQQHLQTGLSSCYLLFGDEPQQKKMALDAIRQKARAHDFVERTKLCVEAGFSWQSLTQAYLSMSLFSSKQFIELELTSSKIGTDGAQALLALAQHLSPELLLLIHGPSIAKDVQKTKWFSALDAVGISCLLYPLDERQLVAWVREQLSQHGLGDDLQIAKVIAECCEGNMLAAAQEVEKLALQFTQTTLRVEDVIAVVAQQSRFTLFQLIDAVLLGEAQRAIHILQLLEAEAVEPNLILWGLTREWQTLYQAKLMSEKGQSVPWQQLGVWRQRQSMYQSTLQRLSLSQLQHLLQALVSTEQQLKQSSLCRPYITLAHLLLLLLGYPVEHFSAVHA